MHWYNFETKTSIQCNNEIYKITGNAFFIPIVFLVFFFSGGGLDRQILFLMSFKLLILLRVFTMALDFTVTAAELELLNTGSLNNHS